MSTDGLPPPYLPISDYAVIGDCRSAALISRWGSVDWLCWPRFDSPSLFAAVLDARKGGRFAIRPVAPCSAERRYLPGTALLETTFRTAGGVLRVVDLMPIRTGVEQRKTLAPDHELLRLLECPEGEVDVEIACEPRPGYGGVPKRLTRRGGLGFCFAWDGKLLTLRGEVPLEARGKTVGGTARLRAGDRRFVSLSLAHGEPARFPVLGDEARLRLEHSARCWRDWTGRCRPGDFHRDAVVRSAITLRLLTYAPSGAVVAAPTTSLPEWIGGVRNWDYRLCWLRDASLTVQALLDLGYREEGERFLSWLIHSTRLSHPELRVVYDVYGRRRLREVELPRLEGYRGSRPVRIGNHAATQHQLDVYGEVVDAIHEFVIRGGSLDRPTARFVLALGETVCRRWKEPDAGIWETRAGARHHTHSKVMCWVALDRIVGLHEKGSLVAPVDRYRSECDAIRSTVRAEGWNETLHSYTSVFGGDTVDASLLLLARYAFEDPAGERMTGTIRRVEEQLGDGPLVYRFRGRADGVPSPEGTFDVCSFWAVHALAAQGRHDDARVRFEQLLEHANDVGLFGEEIDPASGATLGNFPQAFTHVGLLDAALTLSSGDRRRSRAMEVGA